jgi:hypothetical protein
MKQPSFDVSVASLASRACLLLTSLPASSAVLSRKNASIDFSQPVAVGTYPFPYQQTLHW